MDIDSFRYLLMTFCEIEKLLANFYYNKFELPPSFDRWKSPSKIIWIVRTENFSQNNLSSNTISIRN